MCRFIAYLGNPILMSSILYRPENSLIGHQSHSAKEIEKPLNGDGFGVGWYVKHIESEPAIFTSVTPAWNNRNLRHIAPKIHSNCILAHVRDATKGAVSDYNCHPFQYKNFLFLHNGDIFDFPKIKRKIQEKLDNRFFNEIKGQTDSENFFALLLNNLEEKGLLKNPSCTDGIAEAIDETITEIKSLMDESEIDGPLFLNIVLTDGKRMWSTRYVSREDTRPHTLYYSQVNKCAKSISGSFWSSITDSDRSVLVASEKLTNNTEDWIAVPRNTMLIIEENYDFRMREMSV